MYSGASAQRTERGFGERAEQPPDFYFAHRDIYVSYGGYQARDRGENPEFFAGPFISVQTNKQSFWYSPNSFRVKVMRYFLCNEIVFL